MKLYKTFISVLMLSSSLLSYAEHYLDFDGEDASCVGIYIKDISTGKVLVEQNANIALTPASVMKAVTTATALSICGPDTCFTTQVGLSGEKQGSAWHGNIVVNASADPTIESENFKSRLGFCDSIAAALRRRGITKIDGGIIVKQTLSDEGPNLQWEVEDIAWAYGAALFGFNYRDNTVTIKPATGEITPEAPGLEVCVEKATENNLVRGIYSNRLMIFTRDPKDVKWQVSATVPDPAAVFEAELRKTLVKEGIAIGAKPLAGVQGFKPVYVHRSPRFSEIMKSLMVRSDNMFAEGILRAIAPGQSRADAITRVKTLWADRGLNSKYTTIRDGSGLARANRISPLFLGNLLEWMASSDYARTYASFFPRAGKDGTMRGFLAKSPLKGRIALKTGSVGGVQCYAGYNMNADGEPTHVIVIMVNGFFCPRKQVREAAENLLTELFL